MLETRPLPREIAYETLACCDLCGSEDLALWDRARSNTLSRCRRCGLVFTNPRMSQTEDKDRLLYDREYFHQKSRMTPKLVAARKLSYRSEIAELDRLMPSGGRILDVGCGMGLFLRALPDTWEKYGCDVSTYALKEAEKQNIQTYLGEFEKLDFGELSFNVVYFRASMHHTYSPRRCFEKAFQILRIGGIVAIVMSNNYGSICGRLFKGHIKSYEQTHNYLFSPVLLARYLQLSGFIVEKYSYPYFGSGYSSLRDFFTLPFIFYFQILIALFN